MPVLAQGPIHEEFALHLRLLVDLERVRFPVVTVKQFSLPTRISLGKLQPAMDEQQLRERIAELEAENAELRRRLAQLEHELQKIRQRSKRPRSGHSDPKSSPSGPPSQGTS